MRRIIAALVFTYISTIYSTFAEIRPINERPHCYEMIIRVMGGYPVGNISKNDPLYGPTKDLADLQRAGWVKRITDQVGLVYEFDKPHKYPNEIIDAFFKLLSKSNMKVEDVLIHSQRLRAAALALAEGNPWLEQKSWKLELYALLHDLPEGDPNVGDILPHDTVKRALKDDLEMEAMVKMKDKWGWDDQTNDEILSLFLEYEFFKHSSKHPIERSLNQLDKADAIITSFIYRSLGDDIPPEFYNHGISKVTTPQIRELITHIYENLDKFAPEEIHPFYIEGLRKIRFEPHEI